MAYDNLFSPIQIRGMALKNRVIFPAMGTKMGSVDKFVTDQVIDYHVERALGGNGLNFTEVCGVDDEATPEKFLSIGDDKYIPMLTKLCDSVHEAGGKMGVQLWQAGMATASYQTKDVFVPSDVVQYGSDVKFEAATVEEIKGKVEAFGKAAARAVQCGFDCVEFHAGHNYSPHAFLSAAFNQRTDEYGGSLENRARYLIECIEAIRKNIPEDMPLFMRIVAHDDNLENGLTIEDTIAFCKLAKAAGVDVLDVSRGNFSSAAIKYEVPPVDLPRGFNVSNAERIRKETGMLTVAVGRINDPEQANNIIKDDRADMVVIGRAQLADPEFCNKAKAGKADSIVRCVGCNQGCYDGFVDPEAPFITCLRNPALGREREYRLIQTQMPKTVLIAGGGIAGLEAAITLKKRGHNPIICEAGEGLGGQFVLAGEAPRKAELKEAVLAMGELAKKEGIEIRFSTPVTKSIIDEINPDEVILAIGAEPIRLNVPGIDQAHVTNSHHILAGNGAPKGRVVVIGGGLVGLEVAEYLEGKVDSITVVEMLDQVAKDLGYLRKICVMESLHENNISTITNAKCIAIKENAVLLEIEGKEKEIPADYVVVAIGAKSRANDELVAYCEVLGKPCHVVGDAVRARRALNATAEAGKIARAI